MERNAAGSRIAEYYPKTVFSKRYPDLAEAVEGIGSASKRLCELLAELFGEMSALECVQMAAWHMVRHIRKLV